MKKIIKSQVANLINNGMIWSPGLGFLGGTAHSYPRALLFPAGSPVFQSIAQERDVAETCNMLLLLSWKAPGRKVEKMLMSSANIRTPLGITSKTSLTYKRKSWRPRLMLWIAPLVTSRSSDAKPFT